MNRQDNTSAFLRPTPQRGNLARRSLVVVVVAAAAIFALLAQLGENGVLSWWQLRAQTARLEGQVQELESANAALAKRLESLATDPEALETLAREEYGMRRPDEEVLTVLQPAAPPAGKADPVP